MMMNLHRWEFIDFLANDMFVSFSSDVKTEDNAEGEFGWFLMITTDC